MAWQQHSKTPKGVWMKEDYSREIEKRREILWPYLRAAYQGDPSNPRGRVSAYIRLDKFILNDQTYSHINIDKIPAYVRERVDNPPASRSSPDVTIFFTKKSILSNFHPADFELEGQQFTSVEQSLSYKKTLLFKADDVAQGILQMDEPSQIKKTSQASPKLQSRLMDILYIDILYKALCAKFSQNQILADALLDTRDNTLGEAGRGPIFVTGLPLGHSKALEVTMWKGDNLQGSTLMRVRQDLRDGNF